MTKCTAAKTLSSKWAADAICKGNTKLGSNAKQIPEKIRFPTGETEKRRVSREKANSFCA